MHPAFLLFLLDYCDDHFSSANKVVVVVVVCLHLRVCLSICQLGRLHAYLHLCHSVWRFVLCLSVCLSLPVLLCVCHLSVDLYTD